MTPEEQKVREAIYQIIRVHTREGDCDCPQCRTHMYEIVDGILSLTYPNPDGTPSDRKMLAIANPEQSTEDELATIKEHIRRFPIDNDLDYHAEKIVEKFELRWRKTL